MIRSTLTYHLAMRILLEGTCGANIQTISTATRLNRDPVRRFLHKGGGTDDTIERIAWFVWRRLNASVLLGPEDLQ